MQAGLWFVKDLFDQHGKIITFQTWMERGIPKSLFLQYLGIVAAIPKHWKESIKQNIQYIKMQIPKPVKKFVHCGEERSLIETCTCKFIYNSLLSKHLPLSPAKIAYTKSFNVTEQEWKLIYLLPQSVTCVNKVLEFQYKVLQRYLCTNILLNKLGIRDNMKCTFCKEEDESIEHLMYNCGKVKELWTQLTVWWLDHFNNVININLCEVLLGKDFHNPDILFNSLLLYGKYYIYKCRINNTLPTLKGLLRNIKYIYRTEEYVANKKNRMAQFVNKWRHLKIEDLE